MSVDVKKNKSPSSARKSMFAQQQPSDALFPEFPSYYPDLRSLHDSDPFVQAFERDFLYPALRDSSASSTIEKSRWPSSAPPTHTAYATLLVPQWEAKMSADAREYEQQCHRLPDAPGSPSEGKQPLTEEVAAAFGHLFPQHEMVIRQALCEQSTETFCEGIATEIVERAASAYAARCLDAVKNAYTALAIWDELRHTVAASFLPRDNLSPVDATASRVAAARSSAAAPNTSSRRQCGGLASVRAILSTSDLIAASCNKSTVRGQPSGCLSRTPFTDAGSVAMLSPGPAPAAVPIDHFCRYVVEQALAQQEGLSEDADVLGDGETTSSQQHVGTAPDARTRPHLSHHATKEATAQQSTTATAGLASTSAPVKRGNPDKTATRTQNPLTARRPTPPPPKQTPSSAGPRNEVVGAEPRFSAQDDLTLALRKVGTTTSPSAVNFGATAPSGGAVLAGTTTTTRDPLSTMASIQAREGPRGGGGATSKRETSATAQKRKPLYRIVGSDAFPAHEVEKERSKLNARRTVTKPTGDPPTVNNGTVYRFTAATSRADQAEVAPCADPVVASSGKTPAAPANTSPTRVYLTSDAKRAAQIKEKQRLRRAQEEREQRFVNIADGEATRALLEHQLDVHPQPGVTLKQADGERGAAGRRPGARPTRRHDEAAVLADGGEFLMPDGKKTWSDATNPKSKASTRPRDSSRSAPAATKSSSEDATGKLPRVR